MAWTYGNGFCTHGVPFGHWCSLCGSTTSNITPSIPYQPFQPGISIAQQGWECPKCARVFAPTIHMCLYCPEKQFVTNAESKKDTENS